jgi:Uma2 family endonuclease
VGFRGGTRSVSVEQTRADVKVAWLVDDRQKQVTIYRQFVEPEVLDMQQTLTLDELIPGFRLALTDLFPSE